MQSTYWLIRQYHAGNCNVLQYVEKGCEKEPQYTKNSFAAVLTNAYALLWQRCRKGGKHDHFF